MLFRSMNMLLFDTTIFDFIVEKFPEFFDRNKDNMDSCEFLIPDLLFDLIQEDLATAEVIKTDATWYGVTYKEDAEDVKNALKELVETGEYPNDLWA